ncbi:hypothetical protein [Galbibacter pacificus]|uniref:Uncharacterized protein n=1 Tax=Galbibacter pacificus TaxID=2996052 RepID=A0ABT6FV16_9FLAO|nr:hypothetical protein [Galbibacter pacificus]MDG3583595.1 hypothetical protein [Galbibacter pacificus]MDG3586929.1 hypothetical protein [Galbibacter pacificus]
MDVSVGVSNMSRYVVGRIGWGSEYVQIGCWTYPLGFRTYPDRLLDVSVEVPDVSR